MYSLAINAIGKSGQATVVKNGRNVKKNKFSTKHLKFGIQIMVWLDNDVEM
jgi:hypothetical protein